MIQIIGWVILNSLWQIALITSLYLLIKNNWQKPSALQKYYLAVSALGATFLSILTTFGYLFWQNEDFAIPVTDRTLSPITGEVTTPILPLEINEITVTTTLNLADYLTLCLPYLVAFWGLGMLYFTIRFFKNLYGINKLQKSDNELINVEWLTKIKTFKKQLNIEKEVQVFLSKHVKEPITFGHFKPIILLPISLVTGFDNAAIETIILHELAHIKRHDYLVNLGQSLIEIILFYHPLVWWMSREIRELREYCCDDLVLSLGDNRTTYVETLTALQWRKIGGMANRLSLSASGGDAGFSRRIKRMFGVEEERGNFRQLMGLFLVLLIFAIGGVWLKTAWMLPVKPTSEHTFVVHEDTTFEELDELTQEMRDLGIFKSFCWSMDVDKITSIDGAYYDAAKNIQYFDITDIRQTPKQFIFADGYLQEIKDHEAVINLNLKPVIRTDSTKLFSLLVDSMTTRAALEEWEKTVNDQGIYIDFKQSVFDETGRVKEVRGNYDTGEKSGEFWAILPCVNAKFELIKEELIGPTFLYPCRDKNIVRKQSKISDTLTYLVSDKTTKTELDEMIAKIRAHSQVRIDIDPFKTKFDEQDKLLAVSGKYIYERRPYNVPTQTFEITDLSQFQLRFKAHPNASFAPAYYNIATKKFIHVTDHYSAFQAFANQAMLTGNPLTLITPNTYKDINAILIINEYTNITDLQAFAEKILPNNIIFRYQDSEFRPDGTIAKLVGDFLGNSRISEPFYVDDLTKYQVKLRVDKEYIYQPEITSL